MRVDGKPPEDWLLHDLWAASCDDVGHVVSGQAFGDESPVTHVCLRCGIEDTMLGLSFETMQAAVRDSMRRGDLEQLDDLVRLLFPKTGMGRSA